MTDDQKLEHAIRIAQEVLENVEFSYVYEDGELPEDATEDDWRDIQRLILSGLRVARR